MAHGLISSKNTNKNKKIDKVKRSLTLRCLCQYCDPRYDWAGQCSEFRLSGLSASHVIIYCDNALGYRSSLALCLTKVRSSRACCPATALIWSGNFFLVAPFPGRCLHVPFNIIKLGHVHGYS